jgi:hypothetical protein
VVLNSYPTQPLLFQEDLHPLVPKIIALYGLEEWQTTVLTNEQHRHLGIYSILGAKMGMQARELLTASLDELVVESLASLAPPVSCLNDGLEVATGASLGGGTISEPSTASPSAEAGFVKGNQKLRVRLKRPYAKDPYIVSDIDIFEFQVKLPWLRAFGFDFDILADSKITITPIRNTIGLINSQGQSQTFVINLFHCSCSGEDYTLPFLVLTTFGHRSGNHTN